MSQPDPQFRLVRPDDHLELRVMIERLTFFTRADGSLELRANRVNQANQPVDGFLALQIQSQHLVEWADAAAAPQGKPIFGDSTTVWFIVPAGGVVPFSVEGILTAARSLAINYAPPQQTVGPPTERTTSAGDLVARAVQARAGNRQDPLLAERRRLTEALFGGDPPSDNSQGPAPAVQVVTELHFPSRLVMDVLGSVGFNHAAQPFAPDGRVELWHTRLSRRSSTGALSEQPVSVYVRRTQELPANLTTPWAKRVGDDRIRSALKQSDRTALAAQGSAAPATAARLALSAMGAWLDLDRKGPPAAWEHHMIQGRDVYVRTAGLGVLYPLGHEALRVDVTERVFPKRNLQGAVLKTTRTIIVKERVKSYPDGDRIGRAWPWASVRILTRSVTGELETVAKDSGREVSIMMGAGRTPFEFECIGTDRGGRVTTFELPLYFVPSDYTNLALGQLENIYRHDPEGRNHGGEIFRTVTLTGQRIAVAPVVAGGSDAADVVAESVRLAPPSALFENTGPTIRPAVEQIVGTMPAFEQLVPSAAGAPTTVRFAAPYLEHGFTSDNKGEALLVTTGARPLLDLAGKTVTGGLVAPKYHLTALSRKYGPVGGAIGDLANGTFNPATLFDTFIDEVKLLGVFPLSELLGSDTQQPLQDAPKLVSTTFEGVTAPALSWQTNLFKTVTAVDASVGFAKGTLRPRRQDGVALTATLNLTADTSLDAGAMRHGVRCEVKDLELAFSLSDEELLVLPIRRMTFESRDGGKLDVDVDLGAVQFKGVLAFIRTLAELIPSDGFHDPPALDVRPDGVTSSFSLPLPPVAVGVFVLDNIALFAQLELFFAGGAPAFSIAFARPESPFRVTVAALGGGGWISIKVATDGFRELAGALEFGAAVTVDLGVARGSVSAMGGLSFFVDGDGLARLTAYFTVRGELRVLGLISISVEQTLALGYESPPPRLYGKAELVVKVKLLFVSKSVKITFEKTFAGAEPGPDAGERALAPPPPPTFADLMGAGAWDTYCLAYAED